MRSSPVRAHIVIEIYSGWFGECMNIHNFYKIIRKEYDDPTTLSFLACKSDEIDSLEEYRGQSQPYFMIYRNGLLKAKITGVDLPTIEQSIRSETPMSIDADDLEENPIYLEKTKKSK